MKIYVFSDVKYPKTISKEIRHIETKFGKSYTRPITLHLTFLGCKGIKADLVKGKVKEICSGLKPIKIEIIGLGNRNTSLVYLKVKKTRELSKINRLLYYGLSKNSKNISDKWKPLNYKPHLTLMYDVKDYETLNKILDVFKPIKFPIKQELTSIKVSKGYDNYKLNKIVYKKRMEKITKITL
jgi:2'-5' RNA ligase